MYLPRREIVRQTRALLGIQTDNDLGSQLDEQHVAVVNAAALRVQTECGWVNTLRRVTVEIESEQTTLNYPGDCRPGAIRAVAVYDTDRYFVLEPRVIPVQADSDQEVIAGQPTLKGKLGRPKFYQERSQIELWPRTDKAYPVRLEYQARIDMPTDDTVSIVDGQLIIYAACSMLSGAMGDTEQRDHFGGLYKERMMALRGWQSAGNRFAMDSAADFGEEEFFRSDVLPNWNRSPTMAP